MAAVKFEVYLGPQGKYAFKFFGKDGNPVTTSVGFLSKDACMDGIRAIKEHSLVPANFVMKKTADAKTNLVLQTPSRQVLLEAGPFENAEACEVAITSVRMSSQAAVIELG